MPGLRPRLYIYIYIYIYIWLGSAQLVQAGLGQASLAWLLCVHAWITHACFAQWHGNYFARGEEQKKLTWCSWRRSWHLGTKTMVKLTGRCYSSLQFFLYSSFSLFYFFCFLCFFAFSVFVSLFVFSLSSPSSVRSFSSLVRPCISLLEWLLKMEL